MAKKIIKKLKIVLPAGKATPAPPTGPVLGQAGVNIGEFITKFNDETRGMDGVIPAEISVYEDRSFSFILKTPPTSSLIMKAVGKEKGSGKNKLSKIGSINEKQLSEIAETKMPDLNTTDINSAKKTVAGTARSMGVDVK